MNDVFIVAELSANHGHDIQIVKDSIVKAKEIGCNALKIQTARPDGITLNCDNEYFRINSGTLWDGRTLYDLYGETHLPWSWHKEIFEYGRELGITVFSSPFDFCAIDLLEECGNPIYKIASFEITDIPLIKYAASKGKPIVISTGIATIEDIEDAVNACRSVGNNDITLLQCTSAYPAKIEDANLLTMMDMQDRFGVKVGLSDHSEGSIVAITAAAMGAVFIEKHFTLDKKIGGPDASFSMEPKEFKEMISNIRNVEKARGIVTYAMTEKKRKNALFARSLFVVEDVKAGDIVTSQNVRSIRPGNGMKPKYTDDVMGMIFKKDTPKGTPLLKEMLHE